MEEGEGLGTRLHDVLFALLRCTRYHVTVTPLLRVMINLMSHQHSGVVHGMLAIVTRRSLPWNVWPRETRLFARGFSLRETRPANFVCRPAKNGSMSCREMFLVGKYVSVQ